MGNRKKQMNGDKLSVVVVVKDGERKIAGCIKSAVWANEVIVVDTGSVDKTKEIAKSLGAKVHKYPDNKGSFREWRNYATKLAKGNWILHLDVDERVTLGLKKEIQETIVNSDNSVKYGAFAIPRKNIILGKEMKHGGLWPDFVIHFLNKQKFDKWTRELHEEPLFEGKLGYFNNPIKHLKHDNIKDMITKTNKWSETEGRLLFESGHPKMTGWRFVRIMLSETWLHLVVRRGILDGYKGIIYALYLVWSKLVSYTKLWELQLKQES